MLATAALALASTCSTEHARRTWPRTRASASTRADGFWTILSFNILLVGDFAKLNDFVMGTWTNDWAVGINQDALRKGAVRVDNGTVGEGALLLTAAEQEQAKAAVSTSYTQMKVQECGCAAAGAHAPSPPAPAPARRPPP